MNTAASTKGTTSSNSAGATGAPKRSRSKKSSGAGQASPQVTFPPDSWRPCFCCYDQPFVVGTHRYKAGVYHHYLAKEKDPDTGDVTIVPVNDWICSVLRVLHIVRTEFCNENGYLLEYIPQGFAHPRRMVLRQSLLLGRAEEALKALRDKAVSVLRDHAAEVAKYLDKEHLRFSLQTPDDFWTSVKVVGWSPVGERFVLPDEIIGKQTGVWFDGKGDIVQYEKAGTFDEWNTEVAGRCEGNSYLMLALCTGLSGPLLEPLNVPGLGFHYFGDSTTGKTTCLAVGGSAWARPRPPFIMVWRTTINGLEIQAESRSSTLLLVDESHQADPKTLDASVYMLLNGTAKARMNKDTSAREIARWIPCVLSSGERSIETHQATANIDHKAGQTVRIIDVRVVNGIHGLFEDIHGAANAAAFSDSLRTSAEANYGHAAPMFIQKLIDHYSGLSLPSRLAQILKEFGTGLSAQDTRVARSFAVAALAGELAIEWGILPWPPRSALLAAIEIFNHWKATQPKSAQSKEHADILKGISDFLGAYGDTRFTDVKPKTYVDHTDPKNPVVKKCDEQTMPKGVNRAGYWDDSSGSRIFLFYPAALLEAAHFDLPRILTALEQAGALAAVGNDGHKAKRKRIPDGGNPRLYWINPEKLDLTP